MKKKRILKKLREIAKNMPPAKRNNERQVVNDEKANYRLLKKSLRRK